MNPSASAYAGSNRRYPSITPTRNAHDSALCVVLNLLDYLPLKPHNPQRDGCSHIVYSPVSSENPAGYTVSGMSAIPFFRRKALKNQSSQHGRTDRAHSDVHTRSIK